MRMYLYTHKTCVHTHTRVHCFYASLGLVIVLHGCERLDKLQCNKLKNVATNCNTFQVMDLNECECMRPMRQRMQRKHRAAGDEEVGYRKTLCTILILFGENKRLRQPCVGL